MTYKGRTNVDEERKRFLIAIHEDLHKRKTKILRLRTDHLYVTNIPSAQWLALIQYMLEHHQPGSGTAAILTSNLKQFGRLDDECRDNFWDTMMFLWNHMPEQIWGSEQNVRDWLELRRHLEAVA